MIFLLPARDPRRLVMLSFVGLFWLIDGVVGLACILSIEPDWAWKLKHRRSSVWSAESSSSSSQPARARFVPMLIQLSSSSVIASSSIGLIRLLLASRGGGLRTGIPGRMVSAILGVLLAFMPMIGAAFLPFSRRLEWPWLAASPRWSTSTSGGHRGSPVGRDSRHTLAGTIRHPPATEGLVP